MTRRHAITLFAAAPLAAFAQTNDEFSFDELLDMGQQFIEENVDEDVLAQLGDVDEEKVRALLKQLQDAFEQDYVLDLTAAKETAQTALPLLDSNTVTEPFAEWLRPRLAYFEVAEELDRATPAPPIPATNSSSPSLRGVMIDIRYSGASGTDQYTSPVSGFSPFTAIGVQTISCVVPPASIRTGELYPGSGAASAFHTSLPASLSNATTVLPSPPTRQISRFL